MCGRIQDSVLVCVAEYRIVCMCVWQAEYRIVCMWQNTGVCVCVCVCGRIQNSVCVGEYRIVCVCGRIQESVCVDSVCVAEYRIVCVWQNTG